MKKINPILVQEKISERKTKFFSVVDFQRLFNLNYQAAKRAINRYIKSDIFVKVKKGLYFLKTKPPLDFEIANIVYQPSYISFESALSYHGIIPETIYGMISATPSKSKEIKIGNIQFSYKRIKKECYLGYRPQKINDNIVLIAEPEKALADFLYFVALRKRRLSYERIKLEKINKKKLINYARCFKNKKILELINLIYD